MNKLLKWLMNLEKAMGEALFHPYKNHQPPEIGYQPFTGIPSKSKGLPV